jgi:hypothetical protein
MVGIDDIAHVSNGSVLRKQTQRSFVNPQSQMEFPRIVARSAICSG